MNIFLWPLNSFYKLTCSILICFYFLDGLMFLKELIDFLFEYLQDDEGELFSKRLLGVFYVQYKS